jgi:hypothetical protein
LRLLLRNQFFLWILCLLSLTLVFWTSQTTSQAHSISFWTANQGLIQQHVYDFNTGLMALSQEYQSHVNVSPNGLYYLEYIMIEDTVRLLIKDVDSSLTKQSINYQEAISVYNTQHLWLDNETIIGIDINQEEAPIYLIDWQSGRQELFATYDLNASGAFLLPNREFLLLVDGHGATSSILLVNMTTRESQSLEDFQRVNYSPNSSYLSFIRGTIEEFYLVLREMQTGIEYSFSAEDLGGQISIFDEFLWLPDKVLFLVEGAGLMQIELSTMALSRITATPLVPRSSSPDEEYLILSRPFGGSESLIIWDKTKREEREIGISSTLLQPEQIAWSDDSRNFAVDFMPNGFWGSRLLQIYDAQSLELRFQHEMPVFDFYPLLDGVNGIAWWEVD